MKRINCNVCGKKLERMRFEHNDALVLRGFSKNAIKDIEANLFLNDMGLSVYLIPLKKTESIKLLREKDMNELGWYKKEKL